MSNDDAVGIFCRIKPISSSLKSCIENEKVNCIKAIPPANYGRNKKVTEYHFSGVFNEDSSQESVCNQVALPLMRKLVEGKDGLLFSYGVTGTGKTYTMVGNDTNPGLIPRILKSLFNNIEINLKMRIRSDNRNGFSVSNYLEMKPFYDFRRNLENQGSQDATCKSFLENVDDDMELEKKILNCNIFVSLVELYGDKYYDLLDSKKQKDVSIKEDSNKNVYLHNAEEIEVRTAAEALYLFMEGSKNRTTAATNLNAASSRSHMIFIVKIVRIIEDNPVKCQVNQLCLADLAGSERANRTEATNSQLKEGAQINQALMVLKMCIKNLRESQQAHEQNFFKPKSSKLTYLFKNIFEGSGLIRMIVCIQGLEEEYSETLHVLDFAESSKEIRLPSADKKRIIYANPGNKENQDNATSVHFNTQQQPKQTITPYNLLHDDLLRIIDTTNRLATDESKLLSTSCLDDHEELLKLLSTIDDLEERYDQEAEKLYLEIFVDIEELNSCVQSEKKTKNELEEKNQLMSNRLFERNSHLSKTTKELAQMRVKYDTLRKAKDAADKKCDTLAKEIADKRLSNASKDSAATSGSYSKMRPSTHLKFRTNQVKQLASKFERNEISKNTKTLPYKKQGFYNSKFRPKRSSGKRVLKQLEKHEIPQGSTIVQPDPENSRRKSGVKTTKQAPTTKELKKYDEYVIQNQVVDDEDAGLTTEYHKGHVIPTAGGGYNVTLYETETLCQSSPFKGVPIVNRDGNNVAQRRSSRLLNKRTSELDHSDEIMVSRKRNRS